MLFLVPFLAVVVSFSFVVNPWIFKYPQSNKVL